MKLPFTRALLPLLVCAASMAAHADKKPQANTPLDVYNLSLAELGQVQISIATGNSTPLDKAPATASVIYAAEIRSMGARNLDDILETVPGLHVALSSLSRLDSVYSIRGIHTGFNPQVLLLLNGVPVQYSLQGGRPTLFRLPVASIERVEVIRGPGSAIYGADAYSGVINVITKDAAAIEATEIGARSGSFGTHDVWLQTATHWQGIGIAFDVAYQETNGDNSRRVDADLQSTLDSVFGTHASLAPGSLSTRYQLLDTHLAFSSDQFQLNLWNWHSTNAGVGAGGAQAVDPYGRDDSDLWMADFTYHLNKSDQWDNTVRLSYLDYQIQTNFNLLPAGTIVPIGGDGNLDFDMPVGFVSFPDGLYGNPGADMQDAQADFTAIYTGWDGHRLRIAGGLRRQTITAKETKNFGPGIIDGTMPVVDGSLTDVSHTEFVYLPHSSRNLQYVSLQDEWSLAKNWGLTAGLRYDDYSDVGSTTNPRLALVWATNDHLTTKLMYGSAFRAPSFAELYFRNNPVSLGNNSLKPELIDTQELSFNYRATNNLQTTLTLFTYQAKDMIEFLLDENATTQATKTASNARDQDGKGFELEMMWKPSAKIHLNASYSRQVAEEIKLDTAIPDAPRQQLKLNANWEFANNWYFNSQVYWIGDRPRAHTDTRSRIDDYTLVNVTLHRKNILPGLDVSVAMRNAADTDAREPSSGEIPHDYPLASRSFLIELKYTLK